MLKIVKASLLIATSLLLEHHSARAQPALPTTIVLVHGAFADGSSWDKVVPLLEARGYNVVAVHEPLTSLAEDVAATKRAIDAQRGNVVLVGHSYGGAVITEAGNDRRVKALVYIAAFTPDNGESINELGKGSPPPPWAAEVQNRGGFLSLPLPAVKKYFAQDLPSEQAALLTSKQGPIATKSFDEEVTIAAWKSKPSWYLLAKQDGMIAPATQELMAKRIKAKVASVQSSHVPMLSNPQAVVSIIVEAAQAK